MIRRTVLAVLPLLAVAAAAQTTEPLAVADASAKAALTAVRAQRALAAAEKPAVAAKPARTVHISCHAAKNDDWYGISGDVDLDTMALTSDRSGKSALLDATKGDALVDGRCGETALPIATSDNWYVTRPHEWGEDILQLPKGKVAAGASTFAANLHGCQYDGEWHASDDAALTCTVSAAR
jgi:hypothetical protein